LTRSAKKFLSIGIKATIIIIAYSFIYNRLNNNDNLHHFRLLLARVAYTQVNQTLILVTLLMLVNWGLEALKWKYLTRRLQYMSVWRAIEAVFCGLTWAIFTPNRLGEYGGRVLFLPPRKRLYGVFTMAIGSFGQNVLTNVMGVTAFLWFLYTYLHLKLWILLLLTVAGIAFALIMVIFYFNISWLVFLLKKIKWLNKYERFFSIIGRYSFTSLFSVLLFCIARFIAFSLEYYLLIHLLIPDLKALPMMMMVFNMFFVQSAMPTIDLLDVGMRGMTASAFFSFITVQQIAIIASVSAIWFINLIVPAILGSIFVLKIKFFDRNS
jgi:hypothetical protein